MRRLKSPKKLWVALAAIFLLGAAGAYGAWQYLGFRGFLPGVGQSALAAEKIHILVMGCDARKGETRGRSDSMMYICADPAKKQIISLSIPRDTLVDIPGHGRDRINEALFYGGPELSCRVVSRLIGQPVDYYVVFNFEGFAKFIDALGGITIDVEKNMYHYDPQDGGIYSIDLKKGVQHLDGRQALMYVRYRSDPLGDIARVERQQKFLKALVAEMTKPANLLRLPVLLPKIWDCFTTNLPLSQAVALAKMAADMHDVQVVGGVLPGWFANDPYWHVDPAEAKQVVARLMAGEPIKQFIQETPGGVEVKTSPRSESTIPTHTYGSNGRSGSLPSKSQTPTNLPGSTGSPVTNGHSNGSSTSNSPTQEPSSKSYRLPEVQIEPVRPAPTSPGVSSPPSDSAAHSSSTGKASPSALGSSSSPDQAPAASANPASGGSRP
ncbi:LCP family glycopolymer transferase [Desulfothermobacter acidiphilus]|uniref:LCP family protein n=1 Tax=Desulfothermobacter acidiphilus TaxID=1938353 RepID=UPI003F8C8824